MTMPKEILIVFESQGKEHYLTLTPPFDDKSLISFFFVLDGYLESLQAHTCDGKLRPVERSILSRISITTAKAVKNENEEADARIDDWANSTVTQLLAKLLAK